MDNNQNSSASKLGKSGGIGGWFSALMGKPKVKTVASEQPTVTVSKLPEQKPKEEPKPPEPLVVTDFSKEDSVKEDIVKFKALVEKYKTKVDEKVAPITMKGAMNVTEALNSGGGVADKPFYKKIIKLFFILFFVLILIYVGATLYNILRRRGAITVVPNDPTPTPIPYEPTKPSVYAEDESILKLEEDIDVLEKELFRVGLRENDLLPPKLDFDVNFK